MKLCTEILTLHPRTVFRISRARRTEVRNVFCLVEADGALGRGEASPNSFYGETAESVKARLDAAIPEVARLNIGSPDDIRAAWENLWRVLAPSRAAQCALDVALWDLLARQRGTSVSRLAIGRAPEPIASFATIGISTPEELEEKVAELRNFPRIKLKSGAAPDTETLGRVLAATGATVAIDANCAWSPDEVQARCEAVAGPRVLFVEQPLPPSEDARMETILPQCPLPILADESCVTGEDVEKMAGRFAGFNIKLVKCGGITPALEMARRGRELGLKTMTGCMLESSLLIAAGAVIAQECDFADLDGAWLLREDPFEGLPLVDGWLTPSDESGLGVEPRKSAARR